MFEKAKEASKDSTYYIMYRNNGSIIFNVILPSNKMKAWLEEFKMKVYENIMIQYTLLKSSSLYTTVQT